MQKFLLLCSSVLTLNAANMGSLLFHGNCTTCHFEQQEKSAPAMMEVQKRYKKAFPNKKEFVRYMSAWVLHPNAESSIMQDAIEKHGLMPELSFEKETLSEICGYIYDTNFTKKHAGHRIK